MKLSHLLIATLVSSSVVVSAQNDSNKKNKTKSKAKTEKKAQKNKICVIPVDSVKTVKSTPHVCPACGRG